MSNPKNLLEAHQHVTISHLHFDLESRTTSAISVLEPRHDKGTLTFDYADSPSETVEVCLHSQQFTGRY